MRLRRPSVQQSGASLVLVFDRVGHVSQAASLDHGLVQLTAKADQPGIGVRLGAGRGGEIDEHETVFKNHTRSLRIEPLRCPRMADTPPPR